MSPRYFFNPCLLSTKAVLIGPSIDHHPEQCRKHWWFSGSPWWWSVHVLPVYQLLAPILPLLWLAMELLVKVAIPDAVRIIPKHVTLCQQTHITEVVKKWITVAMDRESYLEKAFKRTLPSISYNARCTFCSPVHSLLYFKASSNSSLPFFWQDFRLQTDIYSRWWFLYSVTCIARWIYIHQIEIREYQWTYQSHHASRIAFHMYHFFFILSVDAILLHARISLIDAWNTSFAVILTLYMIKI